MPSLKLLVRRSEGLGLTGGQGQVEPPCALGCEWALSLHGLQRLLGDLPLLGWAAQGVRKAWGSGRMHLEPRWVLLISVENPSSLKKKKDNSLWSVIFFLSVCFFMQIIWQWMQKGDSESAGSTFRNSIAGLLRASWGPTI